MRLYLDSTVIRGCADPEFERWSWSLIQDFKSGLYKPIISALVQEELADTSPAISEALGVLMQCSPKVIAVTEKAQTLADLYLDRKILSESCRSDALHVALATLEEADVLVSWNYRHILHLTKLRQYITVNLELGLKPLQIRSPRVVASFELMEGATPQTNGLKRPAAKAQKTRSA